jgi:hypothetical protein
MLSPPAKRGTYPYWNEPSWSRSEKAIARTAFDAALKRELREVMQETKRLANQIREPAKLWDLEHYLTQRHKEIDWKYDCRSSRLSHVLAKLLSENRIREEDLRGLPEDRLQAIRSVARILVEDAVGF